MLTVLPESFSWQNAQSILNEAYQKCIIIRPIFVELMGSLQAGAYLSFCYFWAGKGTNTEWTYQTEKGFTESIYLSQYQQRKARAELGKKGWWEEKMMKVGNTPKLHFKIDKKKLDEEVILLILNKAETQLPSDALETHYSESVTVADSRTERSIQRLPITISNSLTARAEFGELERLKNAPEPEPTYPSLADNQTASPLGVDPDPVDGEIDSAAPRSMNTDKLHKPEPWGNGYDRQQGNRDRAQSGAWFKSGLANKRWKDRQDFDKFVNYVETYAENRRKDPKLNPDGTKYGKDYRTAILSRTASTQDDNDSMLACWKTWNLEPAAPNYLEPKSEEVAIVDVVAESAFQVKFAKLKADNQAKREAVAAEKVRKDEIIRGLHES